MAIPTLQQHALSTSQAFRDQVNAVVKEQALLKNTDTWEGNNQSVIKEAVKFPDTLGFPETIVADSTWSVTYDVWASDPKGGEVTYQILERVQKYFNLLTGYVTPAPPAP